MGGVEFRDGELVVEREPNELDTLALAFTAVLDELGIEHVYVAGYVEILTGRARTTQHVDVLLEPLDEPAVDELVDRLEADRMWGPAMPLGAMFEMLTSGDNIWIAPSDQVIPHLEAKFVRDEADRTSLRDAIVVRIGGSELPIAPFELQIAYKLYLGSQTDFEDAVHLYTLFRETLRTAELERWVEKLGVHTDYERLRSA